MSHIIWASEKEPHLNDFLAKWCSDNIPGHRGFQKPYSTMGVIGDDGKSVLGVMLFHNWDADAGVIEFSGSSVTPRWLCKASLSGMFSYMFDELGCQMVFTRNDPGNAKGSRGLQRMLSSYGFERIILPRMRGRDKDEALHTLTVEAWRNNGFSRKGGTE